MGSLKGPMPKGWDELLIKRTEGSQNRFNKIEKLEEILKSKNWQSHPEIRELIRSSNVLTAILNDKELLRAVVKTEAINIISGGTLTA